jgi:hypothetical protein
VGSSGVADSIELRFGRRVPLTPRVEARPCRVALISSASARMISGRWPGSVPRRANTLTTIKTKAGIATAKAIPRPTADRPTDAPRVAHSGRARRAGVSSTSPMTGEAEQPARRGFSVGTQVPSMQSDDLP